MALPIDVNSTNVYAQRCCFVHLLQRHPILFSTNLPALGATVLQMLLKHGYPMSLKKAYQVNGPNWDMLVVVSPLVPAHFHSRRHIHLLVFATSRLCLGFVLMFYSLSVPNWIMQHLSHLLIAVLHSVPARFCYRRHIHLLVFALLHFFLIIGFVFVDFIVLILL